jgi:hypothetical protein
MKLALVLAFGAVLGCSGSNRGGDTAVDTGDPQEGCDPKGVDDLPPGYARIDGCPGSSADAIAASWAEYCAANPGHERCSGACPDAGACPGEGD